MSVVEAAEGNLQRTRGESSASARFAPRGVPQGGTSEVFGLLRGVRVCARKACVWAATC